MDLTDQYFTSQAVPVLPSNFTFADFWDAGLRWKRPEHNLPHGHAALFSATREAIRSNPLELYERLLGLLSNHVNPEDGHYMERMWETIMTTRNIPERMI